MAAIRRRWLSGLAVALGTLTPAVLKPFDETRLPGLPGAAGCGATDGVQVWCLPLPAALHRERCGGQHDHESRHAERRIAAHRAVDNQRKASDDHERGDDESTAGVETRVAGPHSRGEFGVLGKRLLDLVEQPLLVLRERHGIPPRAHVRPPGGGAGGPMVRDSRPAALPQVYEGVGGSESGTTVECG